MHLLSFSISNQTMNGKVFPIVLAQVDSVPFTDLVAAFETSQGWSPTGGYAGLDTAMRSYCPWIDYFKGYCGSLGHNEEKTALLVCQCGVYTCWPLLAAIETDYETMTWSRFEQPHRPERDYSAFGPFTFDWQEYIDALDDLMEQTAPPK